MTYGKDIKELLRAADRRMVRAVHEERRRVILGAVAWVREYGVNIASMLTDEGQMRLAAAMTGVIAKRIRELGCICPDLAPDPQCGMHETEATP